MNMKYCLILGIAATIAILTPQIGVKANVGGDDITYTTKGVGTVTFRHEYHVKQQGMKCSNCHYKTFQMAGKDSYKMDMAELTKGKFCGSCHNGKSAFDVKEEKNCKRCHKDQ